MVVYGESLSRASSSEWQQQQRQLRLFHGLGPFLVQSLTDVFSSLSQHMSAHVLVSEHALWICFLQDMNKFVEQRVVRFELFKTKAQAIILPLDHPLGSVGLHARLCDDSH